MSSKQTRGPSLRQKLVAKLCKHVGVQSVEGLSSAQRSVLAEEVDALLHGSTIPPSSLTAASKKIRNAPSAAPPRIADGASPSNPPRSLPPGSAASAPTPMVPTPPPGFAEGALTARPKRQAAVRLEDKLVRDAQWRVVVDKDAKEFERIKEMEVLERKKKHDEQSAILAAQMTERQRVKEEEALRIKLDAQRVIESCKAELAQEKAEHDAVRRKVVDERVRRDEMRSLREKEKAAEVQRKIEGERKYLADLQAMEEQKKLEDRQRRQQQQSELLHFLEDNMKNEAMKKSRMDAVREMERQEIDKAKAIQEERERNAKLVALRQTERGIAHSHRQDVILQQYEKQRILAELEAKKEEQRLRDAQEARIKRELDEEQRRRLRVQQQKQDLVQSLSKQLEEHQTAKMRSAEAEASFRRTVDSALQLGSLSTHDSKAQERERQRELVRVLDEQRRQHLERNRHELQTKI